MNICYVDYMFASKSINVVFSGCANDCKSCNNPELIPFKLGADWRCWLPKINFFANVYDESVKAINLTIGYCNNEDAREMLEFFEEVRKFTKLPFNLYLRGVSNEIPPVFKKYCNLIELDRCSKNIEEVKGVDET